MEGAEHSGVAFAEVLTYHKSVSEDYVVVMYRKLMLFLEDVEIRGDVEIYSLIVKVVQPADIRLVFVETFSHKVAVAAVNQVVDNADVVHDLEILIEEKVDHIGGLVIILGRCTPVSETGIHIFKELFDEIKEHGFINRKCSAFVKICTDLACNFRFTAAENRIGGIIQSRLTVAGLAGDKFGGEVIFVVGSAA